MGLRTLRARCNKLAGDYYDGEWARWWNALATEALNTGQPPSGRSCPVWMPSASPGAFVRSVLAGMFALNGALHEKYPQVRDAILDQAPGKTPDGLHLLLSWDRSSHYAVAGGYAARAVLDRVPSIIGMEAEIAWPPMYLVLTDVTGRTTGRKRWM